MVDTFHFFIFLTPTLGNHAAVKYLFSEFWHIQTTIMLCRKFDRDNSSSL